MKTLFFLLLLFFSFESFAQKFAVIENKGENAKYFDYNNPNSFVGVLMNNLSVIPGMVANNSFQGVYDEQMLNEIGVSSDKMLDFVISPKLKIYRPFSEDTIDIIKTNQSLQAYLDSLKSDEDYELLFQINRNLLEKYWSLSKEYSPVRIRAKYYFDIRDLSAILIEEKDNIRWIHFIKSLGNGKSLITLSLTESQIKETECFMFWQFLSIDKSEEIKSIYKNHVLGLMKSNEFINWKNGDESYYTSIDTTFYFPESSYCSQSLDWGNPMTGYGDFDQYRTIKPEKIRTLNINEIKVTQNSGMVLKIYRYMSEDTLVIYKTSQSFESFIDSMVQNDDNQDLISIDRENLKKWWNESKIGDPVRKSRENIVLWREAPESKVAILYSMNSNETIMEAYVYIEENGTKKPIIQLSNYSSFDYPIFDFQNKIELNSSISKEWFLPICLKVKKVKYLKIKESINLINQSTEF